MPSVTPEVRVPGRCGRPTALLGGRAVLRDDARPARVRRARARQLARGRGAARSPTSASSAPAAAALTPDSAADRTTLGGGRRRLRHDGARGAHGARGVHGHAAAGVRPAEPARDRGDHACSRTSRPRRTTRPGCAARPAYLDRNVERLREGAARGRLPVASLVDAAIEWADQALGCGRPARAAAHRRRKAGTAPPPGATRSRPSRGTRSCRRSRAGATRWSSSGRSRARTSGPAWCRCPAATPTTWTRSRCTPPCRSRPTSCTAPGWTASRRSNERALELGARIGLTELARDPRRRASLEHRDGAPQESLEAARAAVRRAEERAPEIMPPPLPEPCAVEPMPPTVAESGMAPHYSPPRRDGTRPGTYWFNTLRASAGAGWDLEAVAFHETVPGHHSQLARQQLVADVPLVQQLIVTVHAEGWGLYAERLADEFGLYSDERAQLGAISTELFRATRLVVDTGLHAFGWSRQQAQQLHGRARPAARVVHRRRDRALHRVAGPGARVPHRSARDPAAAGGLRSSVSVPRSTCRRSTPRCSTAARCRCRRSRPSWTSGCARGQPRSAARTAGT